MTNEGMTIAKSKDKARESKPINKESGHCNREWKDEIKGLSIKNFIMLFLSGVINAIGVTIFIAPVNLYDSGISGTSILLSQLTPEYLSLSVFLIALNVPLFLFGLKRQGAAFTIYAIFAVAIYSISAWLITDVLPVDVSIASPLAGDDLLLCALFGGMISGLGSGLSIRYGGAMDGIEVIAVIFAKRIGITVGTFVMGYNVILYLASGVILKSWILPLYSIVTYAAALKTIDFIVEGIDRSKAALIVTNKPDIICEKLSDEFECGITLMDAKGYYSNSDKTVIYIIVNRFQITKLRTMIHRLDKKAYISISEVADVFSSSTK